MKKVAWLRELCGSRFQRKVLLVLALSVFVASFAILLHAQEQEKSYLGIGTGEARYQDFSITMVGDAEIETPAIAHQGNPRFMGVVNALRQGDAVFANLEMAFPVSRTAFAGGGGRSQWHPGVPSLLKELQWMGFNLLGAANNHALDYGVQGALDTIQLLKQDGITYAGLGENLEQARAPGYLSTAHGRVALITCASTFPADSPAGSGRYDEPGRPGLSPLRHETIYRVDAATFEALRKMRQGLYLGDGPGESGQSLTIPFDAGSVKFEVSDKPGVVTTPDPKDLAAITTPIRDARYFADYVVASIHSHEGAPGPDPLETPSQFLVKYAHAMVDAGADIVVGSGPHVLRGIEIYKGKVIFYSLGNFIFENFLFKREPTAFYEKYGVSPDASPSEGYNARSNFGRRDEPANPLYWQNAVARVAFHDGRPTVVTLTPVTTGFGFRAADQGVPEIPDPAKATQILEHWQKLSDPYGTKIAISNGVGTITISK